MERQCKFCQTLDRHVLEDEQIFLLKCPQLKNKRGEMWANIIKLSKNFESMDEDTKLYLLMTCECDSIRSVAKFCAEGWKMKGGYKATTLQPLPSTNRLYVPIPDHHGYISV